VSLLRAGEHTERMVDMRLQARNKNGHHYVNVDLEDNAIVQIDGKQIHPPKQAEPAPEPPVSERLEVGAIYANSALDWLEYLGYWKCDKLHFFRKPNGDLIDWSSEDVDSLLTFVSRPLLSETVRPGWKIKHPDGEVLRVQFLNDKDEFQWNDGTYVWYPLTKLDRDGYEVVSRGEK